MADQLTLLPEPSAAIVPACWRCGATGPRIEADDLIGGMNGATKFALLELALHERDCPEAVVTVHCVFNHAHTVRDRDPEAAHDEMERHYAAKHAGQIEAVLHG